MGAVTVGMNAAGTTQRDLSDLTLSPEELEVERYEEGDAVQAPPEEAVAEAPPVVTARDENLTLVAPDAMIVAGTDAERRKWRGKQPTETLLKIKGATVQVEGSFSKGERIHFTAEAVVVSEACVDMLDRETRAASDARQMHVAEVLDLEVESG